MSASKWKPYPLYKDADSLEGVIPSHWSEVKTKAIASGDDYSFVDGPFGSDLKNEEYVDSGIPLIQLNNVKTGWHDMSNSVFITEEKSLSLSKHRAFPGDIVIAKMAAPVARACKVSSEYPIFNIVADCIRLNTENVDVDYVVYSMNADYYRLQAEMKSKGTTRIRINLGNLKQLKLIMPPLEEQQMISTNLRSLTNSIEYAINLLGKKHNLLKEKRSALITQAVTKGLNSDGPMKGINSPWIDYIPEDWTNLRIKQIVDTKVTDGPHVTPVQVDEGVPFLSATAVENGRLNMNKMWGYISREDHELYCRKCRPQLEDIFMVKSGATTGSIAFVDFEDEFSVWSPLALIRCDRNKMHPRFVFYSLQSDYLQKAISQTWSKGTQENIAMKAIEELPILKPPLSEQIEIANYIDASTNLFDGLISKTNSIIEMLKGYRTVLVSAAVTGKIDLRGL